MNFIQENNKRQSISWIMKVWMPFQNWPCRVKNIVFLTFNISIEKRVVLKKDFKISRTFFCHCLGFTKIILYDNLHINLIPNHSTFVSASTTLEVNKWPCAPGWIQTAYWKDFQKIYVQKIWLTIGKIQLNGSPEGLVPPWLCFSNWYKKTECLF